MRSCWCLVSYELNSSSCEIYKVQMESPLSPLSSSSSSLITTSEQFSISAFQSLNSPFSQRRTILPLPKNNKTPIFKMVQLTSLISIFLAASGIVSALPSPATESKGALAGPADDLPHGIYAVDLADDGSTVWTFVAPINETLKATTLATREIEGLDKRDGASCNGFGTPADE